MEVTKSPLVAYSDLVKFEKLNPDKGQEKIVQKLQFLNEELNNYGNQMGKTAWPTRLSLRTSQRPIPKGLYIWGGVGSGKTMLMDIFFKQSSVREKKHVHFHGFMQEVHRRIHSFREAQKIGKVSKKIDPIDALSRVITDQAWLLCFDEFHVTDIADAMILGRLFEALFSHGVVIVTTSNRHPNDLYKGGLQRERFIPFIEMLLEKMNVIQLTSPTDYRMLRAQATGIYLVPNGRKSNEKLEEIFSQLTLGAKSGEARLRVAGREIHIPMAYKETGFITFAELCEQPLGPADYLKIAEVFKTLIVSGIPKINAEKRDIAKRFVTLVDALYDFKAKLICSAEVEPEKLYPDGEGAFEFKRTVSRLMEMQSPYYMSLPHGLRN